MDRNQVLGELRQLGATKVHMLRKRESVPCLALYQLGPTLDNRATGIIEAESDSATETVGMLLESQLRFTLTGERADGPSTAREKHDARLPSILADARIGVGASPHHQEVRQSPWECNNATMINCDGFPSCHGDLEHMVVQDDQVRVDTCCAVAGAESLQETIGKDALSQNARSRRWKLARSTLGLNCVLTRLSSLILLIKVYTNVHLFT